MNTNKTNDTFFEISMTFEYDKRTNKICINKVIFLQYIYLI